MISRQDRVEDMWSKVIRCVLFLQKFMKEVSKCFLQASTYKFKAVRMGRRS